MNRKSELIFHFYDNYIKILSVDKIPRILNAAFRIEIGQSFFLNPLKTPFPIDISKSNLAYFVTRPFANFRAKFSRNSFQRFRRDSGYRQTDVVSVSLTYIVQKKLKYFVARKNLNNLPFHCTLFLLDYQIGVLITLQNCNIASAHAI